MASALSSFSVRAAALCGSRMAPGPARLVAASSAFAPRAGASSSARWLSSSPSPSPVVPDARPWRHTDPTRSDPPVVATGAVAPMQTPMTADMLVSVTLVDFRGKQYEMKGLVGQTLSEAAMHAGLAHVLDDDGPTGETPPTTRTVTAKWDEDIFGEGVSTFNTHVIVPEEWFDRLPKMRPDEEDVLQFMDRSDRDPRTPHSRIASAIVLDSSLDGLVVHCPDQFPTEIP